MEGGVGTWASKRATVSSKGPMSGHARGRLHWYGGAKDGARGGGGRAGVGPWNGWGGSPGVRGRRGSICWLLGRKGSDSEDPWLTTLPPPRDGFSPGFLLDPPGGGRDPTTQYAGSIPLGSWESEDSGQKKRSFEFFGSSGDRVDLFLLPLSTPPPLLLTPFKRLLAGSQLTMLLNLPPPRRVGMSWLFRNPGGRGKLPR